MIVILSRGVRDGDNLSMEQPEREEPRFTVSLAGVLRRNGVAREDVLSVSEVDAVFLEIFLALRLIPGEYTTNCSYTTQLRQEDSLMGSNVGIQPPPKAVGWNDWLGRHVI